MAQTILRQFHTILAPARVKFSTTTLTMIIIMNKTLLYASFQSVLGVFGQNEALEKTQHHMFFFGNWHLTFYQYDQ
jgi:hypothetical protein